MPSVTVFPEDFVEKIGAPVDDEVLIGVVQGGIDAAEHFDDLQSIEGAVGVPNGTKHLFSAVLGRLVAGVGGDIGAQLSFQIADVSGGDELVAASDAEIEVGGRLLREDDAEGDCFFLGCHEGEK